MHNLWRESTAGIAPATFSTPGRCCMRMKLPLLAGALCLAIATPAHACNWYFASSFMRLPAKPTFGVGVSGELGDPAFWGISGDVAMKLGDKAVVQPAVGICTGDGETDPIFGAGVAYLLTQNPNMAVNIQSGLTYLSFDGGSEMVVPIGLAANFKRSATMSLYAGASMWWQSVDVDGFGSASSTDPVIFGGLQLASGPMAWTLGGQLFMGDETEFGIILGANMNRAASAIRSFIRR